MINNRGSFWGSIPPVTKNLIAINFIMWLASLVIPGLLSRWDIAFDLTDVLGMHYWASSKFNPAQLITYMFMHGGFSHIFFNMFALYMFGGVLEQLWGTKRFMFYYLITGIGAGIIQQLFWTFEFQSVINGLNHAVSMGSPKELEPLLPELSKFFKINDINSLNIADLKYIKEAITDLPITVGASGAVFGLLLAFGWLFPEAKLMMLFLPIPIPARIFVTLYAVLELFLGVRGFAGDNIAHFAHLGGMLFGAILILYWKRKK